MPNSLVQKDIGKIFSSSLLYFSIFHYRRCQIAQKRAFDLYINSSTWAQALIFKNVKVNKYQKLARSDYINFERKCCQVVPAKKNYTGMKQVLTFFNDWTGCIARDRKSIKTKKQRTKRNNDSLHFSTSNIPRLLLGANSRCNYHGEFPLWSGWCARQYSEFKAVIKWSF